MKFCPALFNQRLKELMAERNLNKQQLSYKLGISHVVVGFWERGLRLPSMENLFALAHFFGVPSDYLLGLREE